MTPAMTGVMFERPWVLAAALAAIVPILLSLRARRRGSYIALPNVAMQCLTVLLAAMALAGPVVPGGEAEKPYLIFTDVSDSTRTQREPLPLSRDLPRQSYLFARGVVEGRLSAPPAMPTDRTELTPSLQLALARTEDIAGVVIHTDGRFQDEGWPQLAAQLARKKVQLLIVPMISPPADALVAELSVTRGADGRVAQLRVSVSSNAAQRRTLRVWREGTGAGRKELLSRVLELLPDQGATIHLDDAVSPDRTTTYRAELSAGDDFPENDYAVAVSPPTVRQAAVISKIPLPGLGGQFTDRAIRIAPETAPRTADGYLGFSCIVLADASGELLVPAQRAALAEYVRQGGGLVIVGAGPHASPADRKDPLNQISALTPNPLERRPLKLVVVLDASGSMGEVIPAGAAAGQVKFAVVSSAVLSLQEHLTPRDALTVYTFSESPRMAYSSGQGPIDFDQLRSSLIAIRPGGGTRVLPAMEEAISRADVGNREGMLLLLSDLRTEKIPDASVWARRLQEAKLSLAVAVSPDASAQEQSFPLEALVSEAKAPIVRTKSFLDLAEVFSRLVRQSRGPALRRGQFAVQVTGDFWWKGAIPPVTAYIPCAAGEGADVLAGAVLSDGKSRDALLARRGAGLGRVVSLAIVPGEPPAMDGQVLGRLLTGAVEWVAAPQGDPRFTGELLYGADDVVLQVTAWDQKGPMNFLELSANFAEGQASTQTAGADLRQVAPGRYETRFPRLAGPGVVVIRMGGGPIVWRGSMPATCGPELRTVGPDQAALQRLAELSGGRIVTPGQLAGFMEGRSASHWRPLWPLLLAGALLAMLLDWVSVKLRRHL